MPVRLPWKRLSAFVPQPAPISSLLLTTLCPRPSGPGRSRHFDECARSTISKKKLSIPNDIIASNLSIVIKVSSSPTAIHLVVDVLQPINIVPRVKGINVVTTTLLAGERGGRGGISPPPPRSFTHVVHTTLLLFSRGTVSIGVEGAGDQVGSVGVGEDTDGDEEGGGDDEFEDEGGDGG